MKVQTDSNKQDISVQTERINNSVTDLKNTHTTEEQMTQDTEVQNSGTENKGINRKSKQMKVRSEDRKERDLRNMVS